MRINPVQKCKQIEDVNPCNNSYKRQATKRNLHLIKKRFEKNYEFQMLLQRELDR